MTNNDITLRVGMEPSEEARALIRAELLKILQDRELLDSLAAAIAERLAPMTHQTYPQGPHYEMK